jgi:hypothetical protein
VIVVVDGADWFIALGTAIYGLMEASWVAGAGGSNEALDVVQLHLCLHSGNHIR